MLTRLVSSRRLSLFVAGVGLIAALRSLPLAAQGEKAESTKKARSVHRLPPSFGDVVSEKQRDAIYRVQDEFAPQIDELKNQLKALVAERDAKILAVLSVEQQQKVADLRAAAKAARLKKAAEDEDEEEAAEAPPAAVAPAKPLPAATPAPANPASTTKPAKPK